MEFGFPELTDSFLIGQNILYTQFNDIEFYVEDTEQENLYFEILKKIFPDMRFEKIFPLGGKDNIINDAELNVLDKKKVYILDLDFSAILCNAKCLCNVFYLEKYSIENYFLEINAIKSVIIEEKPKMKAEEITLKFNLNDFLLECQVLFSSIMYCYLVIQKHNLGIKNVKNDTARFCDFTVMPSKLKTEQIINYKIEIEDKLKSKNKRFKLSTQLKKYEKYFRNQSDAINNIPGKYLLNFLKYRIEHLFGIKQITLESFTFRLAKNSELTQMEFIKHSVLNYIN